MSRNGWSSMPSRASGCNKMVHTGLEWVWEHFMPFLVFGTIYATSRYHNRIYICLPFFRGSVTNCKVEICSVSFCLKIYTSVDHVRHCTHCNLEIILQSHHFQLTIIWVSDHIFTVARLFLDTGSVKVYDAMPDFWCERNFISSLCIQKLPILRTVLGVSLQ